MYSISEKLQQVKKIELEILSVVHNFCVEHNLKYTLAYGTLLGAVRHKGFIPWDDDIDIWMPREDYERFIELWTNNPIDGYLLQTPYNEPEFTQNFSKIRKDNTTYLQSGEEHLSYHKGIFIDVFPLDRVASSSFKRKLQKFDAIFMMLYTRKYVPPTETGLKRIISKIFLSVVPKSKYDILKLKFERALIKKSGSDTGYRSFDTFGDISLPPFSGDMFEDLQIIGFENREFFAPKNPIDMLSIQYGDYMQLPPVEERVWAHHPILIDFEHNYEDIKINVK